ncbi:YjbQ family protein [Candidatus Aerophobetes bacterium]|nr:YjbQ family protein [Candidatus Aerophobetes bacterium]
MTKVISIATRSRTEFIDVTSRVEEVIEKSGVENGICFIFSPHTTAGVTINEGADPSVREDIIYQLNKIVPFSSDYRHLEGNSPAHIKTSLVGSSCTVAIENGKLHLGTWQAIFFCEFDGPRARKLVIKILKE